MAFRFKNPSGFDQRISCSQHGGGANSGTGGPDTFPKMAGHKLDHGEVEIMSNISIPETTSAVP